MHSADALVALARAAALNAHAPYSGFHVGCAVEAEDGAVVVGANMENACYRLGVCAEQAALSAALQAFGLRAIRRIAVAGGRRSADGALGGGEAVSPCGGCRQAIAEAAALSGRDIEVIAASGDGAARTASPISALLPAEFGTKALAG